MNVPAKPDLPVTSYILVDLLSSRHKYCIILKYNLGLLRRNREESVHVNPLERELLVVLLVSFLMLLVKYIFRANPLLALLIISKAHMQRVRVRVFLSFVFNLPFFCRSWISGQAKCGRAVFSKCIHYLGSSFPAKWRYYQLHTLSLSSD